MLFIDILARLMCPFEGCRGKGSSQTNLRVHFSYQHHQDIIVILEEGNQPQPRFPQFDMFIPQGGLNRSHLTSEMCRSGTERTRRGFLVEKVEEHMGWVFSAYGTTLT